MKKIISAIMAVAMTAGVMASMSVVHADAPDGTEENPFIISNVDDWNVAAPANPNQSGMKGAYFKLDADIQPTTGFKNAGATLDMNGHNITTETNKIFEVAGITIKNSSNAESTIHCIASSGTTYVMMIGTGDFKIDNVNVTCDSGQAICIGSSGGDVTLNIKDSKITGSTYGLNLTRGTITIENTKLTGTAGVAMAVSGSADLTVNSGTFNVYETSKRNTVSVTGTSTVTINNGTFTNPNSEAGAVITDKNFTGTLTINNGSFENTYEGTAKAGFSINDGNEGTVGPKINITGGTFKPGIHRAKPNDSKTEITVTGGTFAADPSNFVPEGYEVTKDETAGTWTVTAKGGEVEPEPEKEIKYFTVDLGDKAGSYSKVAVKASNGEQEATATKALDTQITLAEGAGVIGSIGIMVEEIPKDTTFNIISVTLE